MTVLHMAARRQATIRHFDRRLCPDCHQPIITVPVDNHTVIVDLFEWEPRHACDLCAHTRNRIRKKHLTEYPDRPVPRITVHCSRCGNTGYVGSERPAGRMLAIDVAWADEDSDDATPNVRLIGPNTDRRRGEALHQIHSCAAHPTIHHHQQERRAA